MRAEYEGWYEAALAMALRMTGSHNDAEALTRMKHAIELDPKEGSLWFRLGLLHKWRGQWNEGVAANQRAIDLGHDHQGVRWNLMICAMGAGDYDRALTINKEMGMKIERGVDGMPDGRFGPVQVRVSSLGEGIDPKAHVVGTDPDFENLWIDRRSLCHGIVVNATVHDLPVDYGDVVLFDGAPVGYRVDGDERIPRFPLLQILREGAYHRFWFIAQQPRGGQVQALSDEKNAWTFYVHDEQVRMLCHACARNEKEGHNHERDEKTEPHIVSGKLVIAKTTPLEDVAKVIANADKKKTQIAAPALFQEMGDDRALKANAELWDRLNGNAGSQ